MSNIPSPFLDKIKKRLEIAKENRAILDKQIEQATAVRNAYQGAVEQLEKVLAEDVVDDEETDHVEAALAVIKGNNA